jgi:hypothetical protein
VETARDLDVDGKEPREFILVVGISRAYNMAVDLKSDMQ